MANFGFNPYGRTLDGFVIVANQLDGCDNINDPIIKDNPTFVLVFRGNCTFVRKA